MQGMVTSSLKTTYIKSTLLKIYGHEVLLQENRNHSACKQILSTHHAKKDPKTNIIHDCKSLLPHQFPNFEVTKA